MSKDFKVKNGLEVTTNITASGNISASGVLDASGVTDGLAAAIVAEIDNDEIPIAKLAEDAVTVTAGTGLTGGGSITLGGSATVNVIGGDGITANANDIAITAAQTTIESVLKADLVIGEDAQTKIDFETANEIHFDVNNVELVNMNGSIVSGSGISTASFGHFIGDGGGLSGVTATVDIDSADAFSGVPHATQDEFLISDNGTEKRATMTMVANGAFALVSGDATVAAGGALTIAAAQTNINSILATDLILGEDAQTKIDFETADEIHFYANNAQEMIVQANVVAPGADDGTALGDANQRWSDLFLAEGGVINFDNGDVTITQTGNKLAIAGTDGTSFIGDITASGNISASGTIFASKFESAGTSGETISFNDNLNVTGHITASGNISGSNGNILGFNNITVGGTGSAGYLTANEISTSGTLIGNAITLPNDSISGDLVSGGTIGTTTITALAGALSLGDNNITNVGDINADSISVDGATTGLNIDFSGGNTTKNLITLKDNLADALNITEGSNSYIKFITTNSSEKILFSKNSNFLGNVSGSVVSTGSFGHGYFDGYVGVGTKSPGEILTVHGNISSSGTITAATLDADAVTDGLAAAIVAEIDNDEIPIAKLAEDAVTVTAGTGLTGGGSITLGGSGTVNVIGGDGITANANDMAITAAQTTITSIYNTSLKIGRDSTDLIDFATADNVIGFRVGNNDEMKLTTTALQPATSNGLALGASNRQWSDLFLAEGAVINFDNGDVTITQTGNKLAIAGGDGTSFVGHITASGNISSSGTLIANGITLPDNAISGDKVEGGTIAAITITDLTATKLNVTHFTSSFITSSTIVTEGSNTFGDAIIDTHTFNGHITASGNISASGTVKAGTLDADAVTDGLAALIVAEIDNDEIPIAKLAEDAVTVTAGTGLTGGGSITLGGSATVNVIGGDGITANANDMAITAAQTTIESILKEDLVIGEDAQTKIDFETANEIHFDVNNVELLNLAGSKISGSVISTGSFGHGYFDGYVGIGTKSPGEILTVHGNISASGTITAEHIVSSDDMVVTDDLEVQGNYSGSGASTFTIGGNATIGGNIDLEGDIDVNGTANLDNIDVDGTFDFASTGTFNDDVTVVQGKKIIFDSADTAIFANTDNPEDLFIEADDDIFIRPDDNFVVAHGTTNYVTFRGDEREITVTGNISASGFLSTNTNITASGNITAGGTITAEQITSTDDITALGDISASGALKGLSADINGAVDIDGGNLTVGTALQLTNGGVFNFGGGLDNGQITWGTEYASLYGKSATTKLRLGSMNTQGVLTISSSHENTMVISGSSVGIGTTSPGEALEVIGNISSSGTIKAATLDADAVTDGLAAVIVAEIDNDEIPIAKLAEDAITIAGTSTALGGSITADTIAGQISADTISGNQINGGTIGSTTISALAGALSLGDNNITNVGDINADSISVDAATAGLNIDFSGANTGTSKLTLRDNMADALNVTEGSNSYIKFITTNSSEKILISQDTEFVGNISASGYMSASSFAGDGAGLTNVPASVSGNTFATDLKIGRDADNLIDFTTDNQLLFRVGASNELKMNTSTLFAGANDGLSLGATAIGFSDLFLADGAVIGFNNGEIHLTQTNAALVMSGSGTTTLEVKGNITVDGNLSNVATTHITASGNISSSGTGTNFFAGNIDFDGDTTISTVGGSDDISINPDAELNLGTAGSDEINIGRQNGSCDINMFANTSTVAARFITSTITFNHPITASGNISSSGTITAATLDAAAVSDGLAAAIVAEIDNDEIPIAKLASDSVTYTAGTGLTGGGEVTLGSSATLNVIGGDGITANANDMAVTAAQTTITSLLATDIKIGEDDETKVDFETADEIHFYANNAQEMVIQANVVAPGADNGTALGDANQRWSDLFLAEGGVINFDNGDMTITQTGNNITFAGGSVSASGDLGATGEIKADHFVASDQDDGYHFGDSSVALKRDNNSLEIKYSSTVAQFSNTIGLNLTGHITASGVISASGGFVGDGSNITGVTSTVDIDGFDALGGTGLHQTQDHFMFSDNGTEKKITFSNLEDAIFGNVSGDATIAAGGALTIAGTSVENSMLVNDGITIAGADTSLGGSITADTIAGQISADTISGNQINGGTIGSVTITALAGALSLGDNNITNVGDINADSISVDAAGTGLDIVFGGNTTKNKITLTDNLADALNITEGSNSYMKFTTTNSGEEIKITKKVALQNVHLSGSGASTGSFGHIIGTSISLPNDSIPIAQLASDAITIAGTSTTLGGSITADTIAGQISADTISGNQINGGTIGSTTITALAGNISVGDNNITNVGTIDVDKIRADAATNVNIELVTAGIKFNAEAGDVFTFNDVYNNTDLQYYDANEDIIFTIDQSVPGVGIGVLGGAPAESLDVEGNVQVNGNVIVAGDVIHKGDTDTKIAFTSDAITMTAGGVEMLKLVESAVADAVTINEGGVDVNFRVESSNNANMLLVDAGNDKVGISAGAIPSSTLTVGGEISASGGFLGGTVGNQPTGSFDFPGAIMGYNAQGVNVAPASYNLTTSYAVPDAGMNVCFVAPKSGIVEIEVQIYADGGGNGVGDLFFGLSDADSYNAVQSYYEVGVLGFPRFDHMEVVHKWVVSGLTAGTTYKYWFGAKVSSTTGTPSLKWGADSANEKPPFIMKATALPSNAVIET